MYGHVMFNWGFIMSWNCNKHIHLKQTNKHVIKMIFYIYIGVQRIPRVQFVNITPVF